jgi:hypothetical protein
MEGHYGIDGIRTPSAKRLSRVQSVLENAGMFVGNRIDMAYIQADEDIRKLLAEARGGMNLTTGEMRESA